MKKTINQNGRTKIVKRLLSTLAASLLIALPARAQISDDVVKIGIITDLSGIYSANTGVGSVEATKMAVEDFGGTVLGKKIEVILKDDTSLPDVAKRLAQELVVNDKVAVLAGFGITPSAMATAPIATQAKIPEVVMAAGTSSITEASPFVVRTSFTLAQSSVPMAEWSAKNGIKKVVTMVSDYGPGIAIDLEGTGQETQGRAKTAADILRVIDEIGSMAAATLHYWWELYEKDGDTGTVAQRCRNLWDEYFAFTEKMETPRAKRYQQVHYGHCAFLPPEERRFITEDLIRATGGLVGTPDEIIAMLREREAMGLDEITLLPAMDMARQNLRDFAQQVIARY